MSKIYVPSNIDINEVNCVYIQNDDSIYLGLNNNVNYELRYNNLIGDYITKSVDTLDVSCYSVELSHDPFYRKDIIDILIGFFILSIICFYFPYKIFTRAFGRWFKI